LGIQLTPQDRDISGSLDAQRHAVAGNPADDQLDVVPNQDFFAQLSSQN
jgi:hypothetical protein